MDDDDDQNEAQIESEDEQSESGEERSDDGNDNDQQDQDEQEEAGNDPDGKEKNQVHFSDSVEESMEDFGSTGGRNKKRRSNAKAVECLDELGNVVAQYRSGMEAAAAMGVLHGEISLACRGLKKDVRGYRFRFVGEDWVNSTHITKQKKNKLEHMQRSIDLPLRNSKYRGEMFEKAFMKGSSSNFNVPITVKVRKWAKATPIGLRLKGVSLWVPDKPEPTPELQDVNPKKAMGARKKKRIEKMNALMMSNR